MKTESTEHISNAATSRPAVKADSRRPGGARGYTLIEVLVTAAVAGLSMLAAFIFVSSTTDIYEREGAVYLVQVSPALGTNALWKTIDVVKGSSNVMIWRDPEPVKGARFYRVIEPQPAIFSVEPSIVGTNGGAQVYLLGQMFNSNFTARIGGVMVNNVVVERGTRMLVTTPPLPVGLHDVEVLEGNQVIAKLAMALEAVSAPAIRLAGPPELPPAAPVSTAINGTGLGLMEGAGYRMGANVQDNADVGDSYSAGAAGSGVLSRSRFGLTTILQRVQEFDDDADGNIDAATLAYEVPLGNSVLAQKRIAAARELVMEWEEYRLYGNYGESSASSVDFVVPGRGLHFLWAHKYRSRLGRLTPMGQNWDHSYNVFVAQQGQVIKVFDGNGRIYDLNDQGDGAYAADGLFREGRFDTNNNFILTFADKGRWEFHPFDLSPQAGKLVRSVDRNGNFLSFTYDAQGRLIQLIDTLGRTNSVGYNAAGYVASVTDFAGRSVKYAYYTNGEPGGAAGDLKSVTSPIVTNTPNGNDFPQGKTTLYTYTSGFPDNRLNHNLLSITDAKGQTWLRNFYAPTQNPADPLFDRVVTQQRGGSNELIQFAYLPQTASPSNGYATMRTIVNDRVGNVREYFYDSRNRLVTHRAFTGRATPGLTTTDTLNRPMNPLRPDDPPYFETRFEWNNDFLPTRIVHPNGNSKEYVYESDFDPAAQFRFRGNLRVCRRQTGPLGGDQPQIVQYFENQTGFGSVSYTFDVGAVELSDNYEFTIEAEFETHVPVPVITMDPAVIDADDLYSTNEEIRFEIVNRGLFVNRHTDARGNVTGLAYDSRGNCTNIIHRIPTSVDSFEYDSFGRLTAHVLPENGNGFRQRDELRYYTNGPQAGYLRQVIRDAATNALTTTYEYDAVGNVVRTVDPRGHDTLYTRNALNQIVRRTSREVTDGSGLRYQRDHFYDANNNVVRVDVDDKDENGVPSANSPLTTGYAYDLLDRVIRRTNEVSGVSNIISEFKYDANGNLTLIRYPLAVSGADTNNHVSFAYDERDWLFRTIRAQGSADQSTTQYDYDANGNLRRTSQGLESAPRVTSYAFDGYNRRRAVTNAMGNVMTYGFDANGNGSLFKVNADPYDVTPDGAGNQPFGQTMCSSDAMDRVIQRSDSWFDISTQLPIGDGARRTLFDYSADSRVTRVTDDNGNQTLYTYDSAGRLHRITDAKGNTRTFGYDANGNLTQMTDVDKSALSNPDEMFTTTFTYDGLDRRTTSVDNIGNTNGSAYDSRGNRVRLTDARGNATRYEYDGLSRLVRTIRDMNTNGPSAGDPADIVTSFGYDASSRRTSVTDDNGNATRYEYDSLDRRIRTIHADNTTNRFSYDAHDNPVQIVDPNGTVVLPQYDLLNRVTNKTILRGPGVQGTTNEMYQYDGLSRLVRAQNQDSVVTRSHDSLGNLLRETQQVLPSGPTRTNTAHYDGLGNKTNQVYPGGRTISYAYDSLNRVVRSSDADGLIVSNSYVGPWRLERRDYGNGTRFELGYDGLRRVIGSSHSVIASGIPFDARVYQWDDTHNKIVTQEPAGPHLYDYDAANRLVQSTFTNGAEIYLLDGVGNRVQVTGPVDPGNYVMLSNSPPADFQVNQYTDTPFDNNRQYDNNGNLLQYASGQKQFAFDYRNQPIAFGSFGMTNITATYKYDCFGRRLEKNVNGTITRFYYERAAVIEEQNAANSTVATYVKIRDAFDGTPDDGFISFNPRVQMQRNGTNYFFHADDLGSVVKVTDASGAVVEQYQYGDYGLPSVFDSAGSPLANSAIGNPCLFGGCRYDYELDLYLRRVQYRLGSSAVVGRGSGEDPEGLMSLVGNSTIVGGFLDPRTGRGISRTGSGLNPFDSGNNPVSGKFIRLGGDLPPEWARQMASPTRHRCTPPPLPEFPDPPPWFERQRYMPAPPAPWKKHSEDSSPYPY